MARHYRSLPKALTTCTNCKQGKCEECVDVLRSVYTDDTICTCTRKNHSGEPALNQVADPFDGSVHGTAATITQSGEVLVDPEFRKNFIDEFDLGGEG